MKAMNIYLCGVGGQGIGLLSKVLTEASLQAGYKVMAVDTHGLAQRGGTVVSHLRLGDQVRTPMVPAGEADLVISLERLEGLRGAQIMLKAGGTLIYYNAIQQPLMVRSGQAEYPDENEIAETLASRDIKVEKVDVAELPDPRMQNVALLGRLAGMGLIEGMDARLLESVLRESVPEHAMETNLKVFAEAQYQNELS